MSADGIIVRVGLGFRALKGGSVVVGVAMYKSEPRVVLSSFLVTVAEGDRLSLEPYHVATETERGPHGGASEQAVAAAAEGRKRQDALAAAELEDRLASPSPPASPQKPARRVPRQALRLATYR
jgi:hypothetical protein